MKDRFRHDGAELTAAREPHVLRGERMVDVGAALVYVVATTTVTYAVWARVDDVDPTARFGAAVFILLFMLHAGVGLLVGRWWCLALPLVWVLVSVPAGGYDLPIAAGIIFQTAYFWAPTLAATVGLRRLAPRLRVTYERSTARHVGSVALAFLLVLVLVGVLVLLFWPTG